MKLTIILSIILCLIVLSVAALINFTGMGGRTSLVWPLFFVFIGALGYFSPTIVADARKHPAVYSILVVNLFLGWSVIGFVVALAWALNKKSVRSAAEIACPRCAEIIKKAANVCRFCGHELV